MKTFTLKRENKFDEIVGNKATLGTLYDPNSKEICKSLENLWLDNAPNVSCIPKGLYNVESDNAGRFQYWKILDVSSRSAIEIHQGNKAKHTRGCILLGRQWVMMDNELAVSSSKMTLDNLKKNEILPDKFRLSIEDA
jgi:hypothetical protein